MNHKQFDFNPEMKGEYMRKSNHIEHNTIMIKEKFRGSHLRRY